MNSPFTDFIDGAYEDVIAPVSEVDLNGPFAETEFFFQSETGIGDLNNYRSKINIDKVTKANSYYENKGTWGSMTRAMLTSSLASFGIVPNNTPLDNTNFSLAVAKFQSLNGLRVDGMLGPGTFARIKSRISSSVLPVIPKLPVISQKSRWHQFIKNTTLCKAEPLVYGKDTYAAMVRAIRTAKKEGHYIYILGWMFDIKFPLIPNDLTTTMGALLRAAAANKVEIRIMIWNNPYYSSELTETENALNPSGNAIVIRDNVTYGSPYLAAGLKVLRDQIASIPSPVRYLLDQHIDTWKEITKYSIATNEGSHHEKVIIVKGEEGLIGFCGGIDINPDRIGTYTQSGVPIPITGFYDNGLPKIFPSITREPMLEILHDVHCRLEGHGAYSLLQRFLVRWNQFKARRGNIYPPMKDALIGERENMPSPPTPGKGISNVKILHTYNAANGVEYERSIFNTVKAAITNAQISVHFECQYMISVEIAKLLNDRLVANKSFSVSILTQEDKYARSDIHILKRMRKAFMDTLYGSLPRNDSRIKVWVLDTAVGFPGHHKVHSKLYVVDNELVIIGSANCSRRSMTHDSETAAVIFNDPGYTNDFVVNLQNRYDRISHWKSYAPDPAVKDVDQELIEKVDNYFNSISIGSVIGGVSGVGSLAVNFAHAFAPTLPALLRPIEDPYDTRTKIDQETIDEESNSVYGEIQEENSTFFSNENLDFEELEVVGPFANDHETFLSPANPYHQPDMTGTPETENFWGFNFTGLIPVKGYQDPNNSGVILKKVDDRKSAISKNFTVGEFAQNGEGKYNWDYYRLDDSLIAELQALREAVEKPIIIVDGYYPPKYQTEILKRPLSANNPHFSGRGVKIRISGMTGLQIAEWIIQYCDPDVSVSFGDSTASIYVKQPQMPRISSYVSDQARKERLIKSLEELDRKVKASVVHVKDFVEEAVPDALVNLLSPANDIRIIEQAMKDSHTILDEALAVIDKFLVGKPGTDQAAGYMKTMKNFTKLSEDIYKMSPGSETQKFADLLKSDTSGLDFLTKIQLLKNTFGIIESITKLSSISAKKKKYEEFLKSTPGAYFYLSVDILEGATKLTSDTVSLGFAIAAALTTDAATKTELITKAINFEKALKPVAIFIEGLKIIRGIANIVVAIGRGDYKAVADNLIDIGKALLTIATIVKFGAGVVAGITFIYEYYKFMLVTLPGMVGDVVRSIAQGSTIIALRELNAQFKFVTRKYLQVSLNYEKMLASVGYDDSKLAEHSNLQNKAYSSYTFLHRTLYDFNTYVRELYRTTRSTMQYYSSFPSIPLRFYTTAGQSKLMSINTVLENYPKRPAELDFVYINALDDYYSFFYEGVVKCNLEAKQIYEERVQVGWGKNPYNFEVENNVSEISYEDKDSGVDHLIGYEADGSGYEIEPETEELYETTGFDKEDEHQRTRCRCRKKTNRHFDQEMKIAEAIEHQVSVARKTCESLNCWAKSVLNQALSLNLPDTNTIGEEEKKALIAFQAKNNLPQTGKLDFVTERALLETDAIRRSKGTATESAALGVITSSKTKIEDWTTKGLSGVKTKPQHILNSFRDPRKLWAFVLHQMAFKRMGRVSRKFSDPESYINTGAHFCILFDGRIIQLHPLSRMIWHGNCVSPRSVAVEFEGNFPNVKGRWWVDSKSTVQNKDMPTQAQYDSGRFLASYLRTVLGTTHILAHRQSSDSRENDPGPDVWYHVGQWAIDNLGLTDGGPNFKCGTGNPILPEWKTWGNRTDATVVKELWEFNEEIESEDESYEEEYDEGKSADEYNRGNSEFQDYLVQDENWVESETDWTKAIQLNQKYGNSLGWNRYHDKINDLLLPFSGMQNVSLGEEAFAQAVAAWQQQQGFAAKDCDGIIGSNTWARMRSLIEAPSITSPVSIQVSRLHSTIDSKVITRLKAFSTDIESISRKHSLNPNIVRGIIAAESGGNPNSGGGTSSYKGLMQAERTTDQLQPATSIQTGVVKFIQFRDKILNPWLVKLRIAIPPGTDENYLKACLSCYNAGPVTAMKAIQYAHAAGDWRKWLSAEFYLRALLFSGGYDRYSNCNQGQSGTQMDAAKAERLKYRFKTSGWRTEPDPPVWSTVISMLNPVTRCWIETKFKNTPGYLDRFINYYKYFEANPQISQPEVADESLMYDEYITSFEDFDDEDMETESAVSFEEEQDFAVSGESFEIDEQVMNWSRAIELNRSFSVRLGWNQVQEQINDLLLPFSGQQNVSLGEEAFAQALAAWQNEQGLTADGVLGPNTWNRMQPLVTTVTRPFSTPGIPVSSTAPTIQNIFDFNQWHAQKILDSINGGIVSVNTHLKFNPKIQLEKIVKGEQVINVNPNSEIVQILPILYHICEQARVNNYFDIMIGSFIREASGGKCTGHCKGRCIDINFKGGSFATIGSVQMVINILTYLTSLSPQFRKAFGFGLPMQGEFFGNKNLVKFKSTSPSNLINSQLRVLIPSLGIVFPDNDNHLHIQVKWM